MVEISEIKLKKLFATLFQPNVLHDGDKTQEDDSNMVFSNIFAVKNSLKSKPNQGKDCDIRLEMDEIDQVDIKL